MHSSRRRVPLSSNSSCHGQLIWLHCSSICHSCCSSSNSSSSSLGTFRNMLNSSSSRLSKALPLQISSRASQPSLSLRQSLICLALQL